MVDKRDIADIENFVPRTSNDRIAKTLVTLLMDINSKLDKLVPASEPEVQEEIPEVPVQKKTRKRKTEEVK